MFLIRVVHVLRWFQWIESILIRRGHSWSKLLLVQRWFLHIHRFHCQKFVLILFLKKDFKLILYLIFFIMLNFNFNSFTRLNSFDWYLYYSLALVLILMRYFRLPSTLINSEDFLAKDQILLSVLIFHSWLILEDRAFKEHWILIR